MNNYWNNADFTIFFLFINKFNETRQEIHINCSTKGPCISYQISNLKFRLVFKWLNHIGMDHIWLQSFLWWDLIYLQSWFRREPNMLAISNPKRTIYACNLVGWGPNMLAMSKIVLKSCDYDFWTNHAKTNFGWLQAYLVPIERDCKHSNSLLQRLESYLVPIIKIIATTCGPFRSGWCHWGLTRS